MTRHFEAVSQEEFLSFAYSSLMNNTTSPAVTFTCSVAHPELQTARFPPVEIFELIAVLKCILKGTAYTRQHAKILDNYFQLLKELETAVDPISVLRQMVSCLHRYFGLDLQTWGKAELQAIDQLQNIIGQGFLQNKTLPDDQQFVTQVVSDEEKPQRNTKSCNW